jgi:hypothetical protein
MRLLTIRPTTELHIVSLLISLCFILLGLAVFASSIYARFLLAGLLVLLVPGYLLWTLCKGDLRLPPLAVPTLWMALSLSSIPLVFLWSSAIGLSLTPTMLRLIVVALAVVALWHVVRRKPVGAGPVWLWAGFGFVLGLVALTRVLHVWDLVLPPWVDSLHHTLLVRIITETGQVPTSLRPYLPVDDLPYHWGYHAVVATWSGIVDAPLSFAMLASGQVLNTCMVVAMYALGAVVLHSPRAGLLAAGVMGLLSLMPAYYLSWGRYTQLTGLLLLPALLIISMALLNRPTFSWRLLWLAAVLLSGLFLIHYRVVVFYGAWMLAYGTLLTSRRPSCFGVVALRGLALGITTMILSAPWLLVLLRRIFVPLAHQPAALVGSESYNNIDWSLLLAGNNRILLVLALAGAVLAIAQRYWQAAVMVGWIAVLVLLANPDLVGLRSSWLINNHSVVITLFIPVGILVAYLFEAAIGWLERSAPLVVERWGRYAIVATLIVLALGGAWQLRSVVNPATVLATVEDRQALEWAAQHTPPNARFLVNSTHWLNGSPRGTDAGWWLLPLAGRWVSTPPALYIYGDQTQARAVEALNARVAALKLNDRTELARIVRDEDITHVFIGKRGGPIKPELLINNSLFVPVYNVNGVRIFAVRNKA